MDLVSPTKLATGYTLAADKFGREWLVVVAKGTYGIPDQANKEPTLLEEQIPLILSDLFTGEPGFSAPRYEIDFAPRKPRCDVLLNGSCYAPGGKPARSVQVAMRVGSLTKSFNVVGNRIWRPALLGVAASTPEPFTTMPISYNNAYGGIDKPAEDPTTHKWYLLNPVGAGYHPRAPVGTPLPNTEEIGEPVSRPNGNYKPMAFGPVGRSWRQRIRWAGTYDNKWMDDNFPFLPVDFDERYFQCGAEDQQTDYLKGGEEVVLVNLTPAGRTVLKLPALREPFDFLYKNGDEKRIAGVVDTLMIEPDLGRFTLSLRASIPLRRNLHEIRSIALGRVLPQPIGEEGEVQEVLEKPHYKSLADLVDANRAKRERSK